VQVLSNPWLKVDKKIVSEVYTSDDLMDNLRVLCDVYGSRWGGSKMDHDSAKWMVDWLKSQGIDNAHLEDWTFPGWERGPAELEITSPIKKSFDVISLPLRVAGEIEAKLVDLGPGAIDDYEARKDEIDGNVAMVSSARPPGMTRSLHRSEKFMRSVYAGAKGWIFMNHYPAYGPPTGGISPVIPSVGLSYEDGMYLRRTLERYGEVTIRVKTTDKNMELKSYNVICDVPGNSNDPEYVVTGSHYDGHDISQGAVDPASGAAVVLEMAKVLWSVKDKLKRRVRLMCFGVEEIGLFGAYNYTAVHEDELGDCRFMLNLDSAGGPGRKGVRLHDFPELEPLFKKYEAEMKNDVPLAQGVSPYSDHWPFFLKGVPCGSGSDPGRRASSTGRGYGHTRYDTVDKVIRENMRRAASNYTRLLFRVANEEGWNPRKKTPEEIQAFIEKQGYDQTVVLAEKVKAYVKTWPNLHPDTVDWLNRESSW